MLNLQLVDKSFSHEEYSVPQKYSSKLKWVRENLDPSLPTIFSHFEMFSDDVLNYKLPYGILFESRAIIPAIYLKLPEIIDRFKLVFTHSSELLENHSNTRWIPGGGIWIGGKVNEVYHGGSGGDISIHQKSKMCSMVSSDKSLCNMHIFRQQVVTLIQSMNYNVDIFGTLTGKWVPIIDTLKDYYFSIILENHIDKRYFTEKLLNCFATGTIPIYLGAQDLSNDFDEDGIIRIDTPESIMDVLDNLTVDDYAKRFNSIVRNFDLVQNYNMIEDYIYDNYLCKINLNS